MIEELEFLGKFTQKKNQGGRFGGGGSGWGVRVDVNEELKFLGKLKKNWGVRGPGWGGQGGCERRIEVFGKIQKNKLGVRGVGRGGGGRVGGFRVDVNEELKFLGKFKTKIGGGGSGGSGWLGQDGCEQGIEVFVKIQKKKLGGGSGRSGSGGGVRVDVNEELKFL